MAKIKLTKTAVEAAQPKAQDIELRDTVVPGFLCKITPVGRRVFTQAATQAATLRLIALYEQLSPAHLATLDAYYAPDAHFKDPFNDVRGVPAIAQIFAHMFATLDQPRFTVTQHIVQGDQAFLGWEFRFRMRRWRPQVEQCIHGATLVRFDAQGRVTLHRDYWDAAQELYEKLPVLGGLMRWLRRSASATSTTKVSHAHRPSP